MTDIEDDSESFTIPLTSAPNCNNPRADINRDGIVDNDDQILLGAAYGSRPGDANWNPDADINQDGVVDSNDLGILGANFGCRFPTPSKTPWVLIGTALVGLYEVLKRR